MGCCDLVKADRGDAEIDAIARFVRPLLASHWRRQVERAIEEARQRLLELEDQLPTGDVDALARAGDRRDRALEDLITAILAALGTILQQPPSGTVTFANAAAVDTSAS
ncbi:MAG: hypothetical protein AAB295_05200, partial [Chloroflexota bacterium]